MAKIIVLDGATLTDGNDPSWDALRALGDCTVYSRTEPNDRGSRLAGAEIAITNKCVIDDALMEELPQLNYIGLLSTGCNAVDLQGAAKRGITVTNIPAYSTESVVQTLFGLLIEVVSGIGAHAEQVRNGAWQNAKDFCFYRPDMKELAGLTIGIVGYGRIGRRVAQIAKAFGMQVVVYVKGRVEEESGIRFCLTLDELFSVADVVSLNCPLNAQTAKMINRGTIEKMKDGAILLNTARGGLVDEAALADAIRTGKLFGAGLDVIEEEPPRKGSPLIGLPNVVITPHIGWATPEARRRLMTIAVENLKAYLAGTPVNCVK